MSYVIAAPEMMATAATDLAGISATLSAAHLSAAVPTTALVPAADEVSSGIAHLFSQYGADFQALAGKASAFHDQFVQNLSAGAGAYTSTEGVSASFLQNVMSFLQNLPPNVRQVFNSLNNWVSNLLTIPLIQDILFVGGLAIFIPYLVARYVVVALRDYLTTGQILSWSAFIKAIFLPLRMSQVPWNFGGGPVSIRLRSPRHCARRVRQVRRSGARELSGASVGAGDRSHGGTACRPRPSRRHTSAAPSARPASV